MASQVDRIPAMFIPIADYVLRLIQPVAVTVNQ